MPAPDRWSWNPLPETCRSSILRRPSPTGTDQKEARRVTVEALSTRCGGQGVTIFFGMAKPVPAPQIGSAKPY